MSMSILEHPIVLAPMAGFGTVELAAAVADARGLGSIGCATMNPRRQLSVQAQDTPQHVDVPGKSIEGNSLIEHNDGNW
jgi:NAD(P)H-dependent flavin oxidoreductase YrpB (nitropropane dioxygenase family)